MDETLLDKNEQLKHALTLVDDHQVASDNLKEELAALQVGILCFIVIPVFDQPITLPHTERNMPARPIKS